MHSMEQTRLHIFRWAIYTKFLFLFNLSSSYWERQLEVSVFNESKIFTQTPNPTINKKKASFCKVDMTMQRSTGAAQRAHEGYHTA